MTNEEMISLLRRASGWVQAFSDVSTALKDANYHIQDCIKELQFRQKERKWHSVDEEPHFCKYVLCKTEQGGCELLISDDDWYYNQDVYHVTEWCYLDELLNEH